MKSWASTARAASAAVSLAGRAALPFGALVAAAGCDGSDPFDPATARAASTPPPIASELSPAPPMLGATSRPASSGESATQVTDAPRCAAPSLAFRGPLDARTSSALERCTRTRSGEEHARCGEDGRALADLERMTAAVPPFDDATRRHILEVARRGHELGRDPRAFGLVGDSITVSRDFMGALSERRERPLSISDDVLALLGLRSGGTVIDRYRGASVERVDGADNDSFGAFRAAKIGAAAGWATSSDGGSTPIDELVRRLNPAVAVVTFGANDAASRAAPPEEIADMFDADTMRAVAALESAGVVVILSNEMRHGDQPGVKACPSDDTRKNDWRIAVATTATSARAAEIACREHLPFIDLRSALDTATNHGLGPDGVHLSAHAHGAGLMTPEGLDCGYNIRTLVTLIALARVADVLDEAR